MRAKLLFYSFALNLLVCMLSEAQLTVQVGIFNPSGSTLSIRAKPSQDIPSQVFGGVNVTVRWLTSYGITFGSIASSYSITAQGSPTSVGSYTYQDFGSAPGVSIAWGSNTENELFSIPVQSGTGVGTFELDNTDAGGGWYFELGVDGDVTNYATPYYQQSTSGVPLPIQLSSLTATAVNGSQVRLDWSTISETNNYGFEVQKSQGNQNNYATIPNSFVPGHGTTLEPQNYSFIDNSASAGQWFYRLKQIDLDGTVHFTDGVQVDVLTGVAENPVPKEFSLDQNFPNPFNPSTRIEYAVPNESHVRLEVFNVIGQLVATLVNEVRPAGYYAASFNATSFSSGLYFYRMTAGKTSFLKKMVLVK